MCSIETRIMKIAYPFYCSPVCKTERARNVITVFSVQITVKSGNECYWLLTALCWPYFARYSTHIRVVLWKSTEELSFWRNNYFPLNLWVDESLWEEFSSKILMLLPSFFPLRVSCWPACLFIPFFPSMVQNTIISVNLLTI